MSQLKLQFSEFPNGFVFELPGLVNGPLRFSLPEFHATSNQQPFSALQSLSVIKQTQDGKLQFHVDDPAALSGIGLTGELYVDSNSAIAWDISMRNRTARPLENVIQTCMLDLANAPDFHDEDGSRTYVFTETGWSSLKELLTDDSPQKTDMPFHVGASYNATTIIWRLIARFDIARKVLVCIAVKNGVSVAANHNCWGKALLGAARWGDLKPNEEKSTSGRIYVMQGDLDALREKYAQTFRP